MFSDKSYTNPRMRESAKHISCRLKFIEFMIETYEQYVSKKQFPMDDLIEYVVEMSGYSKKEIREKAHLVLVNSLYSNLGWTSLEGFLYKAKN